jgi:cysteinyl-tRNA synthetase
VLEKYDSEVLRFFLLSAHYRSPIDFCDQNLNDAEAGLARIYSALAGVDAALEGPAGTPLATEAEGELASRLAEFLPRFREAMDDDFNTALALAHVFDLIRSVNRLLAEGGTPSPSARQLYIGVKEAFAAVAGVLGVFSSVPAAYLSRIKARKAATLPIATEEIEALIAERTAARKSRDFKRSDEIRDYLLERNIMLLDSAAGTTWKVK